MQSYGTTHRCMFAVSHAGEHEYEFVPGAREAGALSLDSQAAAYIEKLERAAARREPLSHDIQALLDSQIRPPQPLPVSEYERAL